MPSMQSRKAWLTPHQHHQRSSNSSSNSRYVVLIGVIVLVSVAGPSYFLLTTRGDSKHSHSVRESSNEFLEEEHVRRMALEQIGELFPQEVRNLLNAKHEEDGPLNLNGRNDLSSSWIRGDAVQSSRTDPEVQGVENGKLGEGSEDGSCEETDADCRKESNGHREVVEPEHKEQTTVDVDDESSNSSRLAVSESQAEELEDTDETEPEDEGVDSDGSLAADDDNLDSTNTSSNSAAKIARKERREERSESRGTQLIQQDEKQSKKLEAEAIRRAKVVDNALAKSHSIWRSREMSTSSDSIVRIMRDQLIMARAYVNIASIHNDARLVQDLKARIKEIMRMLEDVSIDAELPKGRRVEKKMKALGELLAKAKTVKSDDKALIKKLRAMLQMSEDQLRSFKKQSNFLSQLAAKTMPKGLHCVSMRLTVDYGNLSPQERQFANQQNLEDTRLYHYALFSDNVLAAAVVVNSTVTNAKDPSKHVIHVVTDSLNYGAMRMWFLGNPPGAATIEVMNVDEFKWLNSSYCPILKQLEIESTKAYYFKTGRERGNSNLKYRNPKYLSMLNHLRFYLPEVYPKLDKMLFLDDDIVVRKDLTGLWSEDLQGMVNGAVETCGISFHRFDKYLNFSNPHIARNFDPAACGWAYGMNMFDLKEWKKRDITAIYHSWQVLNADRTLWKLGTLPPGLTTFYGLTHPLDKSWHVLGLGYNPNVPKTLIENAAVVHYNGNLKPWLEIGIAKFKPYWAEYVKYDHPWLQQCNFS